MIRFAQAAAIALCLIPSPLYAQGARFTVTVISASIYQSPNAGSAVIGQSWQGAVLDVRSDLAEWIEVAWPGTARGIGYVRAVMGRIEKGAPSGIAAPVQRPMTIDEYVHGRSVPQVTAVPSGSSSPNPARVANGLQRPMTIDEFVHGTSAAQVRASVRESDSPPSSAAAYVAEAVQAVSAAATARAKVKVTAPRAAYVVPPHFIGLGARTGGFTPNLGATGRVWSRRGMAVQFEVFRDARSNAATAERVTSMQFAPSMLYALPNAVNDYFWVRPYLGGGATIDRSTLHSGNPADTNSSSDKSLGLQLFGGGEVTFAGAPVFALSADVGYRRMPAGFAGFERRKIRFALSGHWFVR